MVGAAWVYAAERPDEELAMSQRGGDVLAGSALTRRRFFGVAGAGVLAGAALGSPVVAGRGDGGSGVAGGSGDSGGGREAKNLIFMVSDGMSMGTLTLADMRIRQDTGRASWWVRALEEFGGRRSMVSTQSANSYVTDSAAAATAWGIGERVANGKVGLTPDGRMPTPLLLTAKQGGMATGLVTTTRITHATPAGFACNIETNRDDEDAIAAQLVERGYDLLLGGGGKFVTDALLAEHGLTAVKDRDGLAAASGAAGPLVGVFAEKHLPFVLDRGEGVPGLEAMSRVALDRLSGHGGGFVLQIEGGRVDHAAHFNDAGSLIEEQMEFDRALGVVLEFLAGRDDTLLVVTTDHGNANPGLTEYTSRGIRGFERVRGARHSFEWIVEQLAKGMPTPAGMQGIVEAATGIGITASEADLVLRALGGEAVDPYGSANRDGGPLGAVLANYTGVAFLSPNHTADMVELCAVGPGSELFPPVMSLEGTHHVLRKALGMPAVVAQPT